MFLTNYVLSELNAEGSPVSTYNFQSDQKTCTVGSILNSDIYLSQEGSDSLLLCEITGDAFGHIFITNLGAPMQLDDAPLKIQRPLKNGSQFTIGGHTFRWECLRPSTPTGKSGERLQEASFSAPGDTKAKRVYKAIKTSTFKNSRLTMHPLSTLTGGANIEDLDGDDDNAEMHCPESEETVETKSSTPIHQKENTFGQVLHRSVVLTTSFSPAIARTPFSRTPRHRTPMSVYKSAMSTPFSEVAGGDTEQYVSDYEISTNAKTPLRNIACVSYSDMDSSTPLSRFTAASAELISRSSKKRAVAPLHLSAIKNNLKQTPKVGGPSTTTPRLVPPATTPTPIRKSMAPRSDSPSSSSSPNRSPIVRKALFSGRKGAPPSSLAIVMPKLLGANLRFQADSLSTTNLTPSKSSKKATTSSSIATPKHIVSFTIPSECSEPITPRAKDATFELNESADSKPTIDTDHLSVVLLSDTAEIVHPDDTDKREVDNIEAVKLSAKSLQFEAYSSSTTNLTPFTSSSIANPKDDVSFTVECSESITPHTKDATFELIESTPLSSTQIDDATPTTGTLSMVLPSDTANIIHLDDTEEGHVENNTPQKTSVSSPFVQHQSLSDLNSTPTSIQAYTGEDDEELELESDDDDDVSVCYLESITEIVYAPTEDEAVPTAADECNEVDAIQEPTEKENTDPEISVEPEADAKATDCRIDDGETDNTEPTITDGCSAAPEVVTTSEAHISIVEIDSDGDITSDLIYEGDDLEYTESINRFTNLIDSAKKTSDDIQECIPLECIDTPIIEPKVEEEEEYALLQLPVVQELIENNKENITDIFKTDEKRVKVASEILPETIPATPFIESLDVTAKISTDVESKTETDSVSAIYQETDIDCHTGESGANADIIHTLIVDQEAEENELATDSSNIADISSNYQETDIDSHTDESEADGDIIESSIIEQGAGENQPETESEMSVATVETSVADKPSFEKQPDPVMIDTDSNQETVAPIQTLSEVEQVVVNPQQSELNKSLIEEVVEAAASIDDQLAAEPIPESDLETVSSSPTSAIVADVPDTIISSPILELVDQKIAENPRDTEKNTETIDSVRIKEELIDESIERHEIDDGAVESVSIQTIIENEQVVKNPPQSAVNELLRIKKEAVEAGPNPKTIESVKIKDELVDTSIEPQTDNEAMESPPIQTLSENEQVVEHPPQSEMNEFRKIKEEVNEAEASIHEQLAGETIQLSDRETESSTSVIIDDVPDTITSTPILESVDKQIAEIPQETEANTDSIDSVKTTDELVEPHESDNEVLESASIPALIDNEPVVENPQQFEINESRSKVKLEAAKAEDDQSSAETIQEFDWETSTSSPKPVIVDDVPDTISSTDEQIADIDNPQDTEINTETINSVEVKEELVHTSIEPHDIDNESLEFAAIPTQIKHEQVVEHAPTSEINESLKVKEEVYETEASFGDQVDAEPNQESDRETETSVLADDDVPDTMTTENEDNKCLPQEPEAKAVPSSVINDQDANRTIESRVDPEIFTLPTEMQEAECIEVVSRDSEIGAKLDNMDVESTETNQKIGTIVEDLKNTEESIEKSVEKHGDTELVESTLVSTESSLVEDNSPIGNEIYTDIMQATAASTEDFTTETPVGIVEVAEKDEVILKSQINVVENIELGTEVEMLEEEAPVESDITSIDDSIVETVSAPEKEENYVVQEIETSTFVEALRYEGSNSSVETAPSDAESTDIEKEAVIIDTESADQTTSVVSNKIILPETSSNAEIDELNSSQFRTTETSNLETVSELGKEENYIVQEIETSTFVEALRYEGSDSSVASAFTQSQPETAASDAESTDIEKEATKIDMESNVIILSETSSNAEIDETNSSQKKSPSVSQISGNHQTDAPIVVDHQHIDKLATCNEASNTIAINIIISTDQKATETIVDSKSESEIDSSLEDFIPTANRPVVTRRPTTNNKKHAETLQEEPPARTRRGRRPTIDQVTPIFEPKRTIQSRRGTTDDTEPSDAVAAVTEEPIPEIAETTSTVMDISESYGTKPEIKEDSSKAEECGEHSLDIEDTTKPSKGEAPLAAKENEPKPTGSKRATRRPTVDGTIVIVDLKDSAVKKVPAKRTRKASNDVKAVETNDGQQQIADESATLLAAPLSEESGPVVQTDEKLLVTKPIRRKRAVTLSDYLDVDVDVDSANLAQERKTPAKRTRKASVDVKTVPEIMSHVETQPDKDDALVSSVPTKLPLKRGRKASVIDTVEEDKPLDPVGTQSAVTNDKPTKRGRKASVIETMPAIEEAVHVQSQTSDTLKKPAKRGRKASVVEEVVATLPMIPEDHQRQGKRAPTKRGQKAIVEQTEPSAEVPEKLESEPHSEAPTPVSKRAPVKRGRAISVHKSETDADTAEPQPGPTKRGRGAAAKKEATPKIVQKSTLDGESMSTSVASIMNTSVESITAKDDPPKAKRAPAKRGRKATSEAESMNTSADIIAAKDDSPKAKRAPTKRGQKATLDAETINISVETIAAKDDPPKAKRAPTKRGQKATIEAETMNTSVETIAAKDDPPKSVTKRAPAKRGRKATSEAESMNTSVDISAAKDDPPKSATKRAPTKRGQKATLDAEPMNTSVETIAAKDDPPKSEPTHGPAKRGRKVITESVPETEPAKVPAKRGRKPSVDQKAHLIEETSTLDAQKSPAKRSRKASIDEVPNPDEPKASTGRAKSAAKQKASAKLLDQRLETVIEDQPAPEESKPTRRGGRAAVKTSEIEPESTPAKSTNISANKGKSTQPVEEAAEVPPGRTTRTRARKN